MSLSILLYKVQRSSARFQHLRTEVKILLSPITSVTLSLLL